MAYGLIQDSTMMAIADGLRDKGIIPATIIETIPATYRKYKSSNATSLDDPTPTSRINDIVTIEAIDGVASMDIEFNIGYEYIAGSAATLYIRSLDGTETYWEFVPSSATDSIQHVHIDAPAVKVEIELVSFQKSICAWVATVQYYDSANNLISVGSEEVEVINTIVPEEMAEAINNFDMPVNPPEEAFIFTGNCNYRFFGGSWDWFVELYGDKITTKDITSLTSTFENADYLKEIPFVLNVKDLANAISCFSSADQLEVCPKIRGTFVLSTATAINNMVINCYRLRDLEDLFEPEAFDSFKDIKITSQYSVPKLPNFQQCYSLRRVPSWWYKFRLNPESTVVPAATYYVNSSTFTRCYSLDEVLDIPVWVFAGALTNNTFSSTFLNTHRIKRITFETNNGQPIVANWKAQTIDLSSSVGYGSGKTYIINYNSGITADKEVNDDAAYQALKNDPDWFTTNVAYSRYNHDSAVETINSLPDTSAYLASAGGTNTIKFNKTSGSKTDGGAIGNLTAEEIAVAAAKGWTVTLS